MFFRTLSKKFSDFFVGIVKTASYQSIGAFWDFKKNVNLFTPNWQIPEKKNQPTGGNIFLSLFKL